MVGEQGVDAWQRVADACADVRRASNNIDASNTWCYRPTRLWLGEDNRLLPPLARWSGSWMLPLASLGRKLVDHSRPSTTPPSTAACRARCVYESRLWPIRHQRGTGGDGLLSHRHGCRVSGDLHLGDHCMVCSLSTIGPAHKGGALHRRRRSGTDGRLHHHLCIPAPDRWAALAAVRRRNRCRSLRETSESPPCRTVGTNRGSPFTRRACRLRPGTELKSFKTA